MSELVKITKSKGSFKINGTVVLDSEHQSEKIKVASVKDGRPGLIRDTITTKHNVNSDFDFEAIQKVCKDINIDINLTKLKENIDSSDPEFYSRGKSHDWTAKSLGELLNRTIGKTIFISYGFH